MIRRRTTRGIVLMAMLLVALRWLLYDGDVADGPPSEALAAGADYALVDFSGVLLDEQGRLKARLSAPRLRHDAASQVAVMMSPVVDLPHEGGIWNITASQAELNAERTILILEDEIEARFAGEVPMNVRTAALTVMVNEKTAHSDAPVELRQPGATLRGRGFTADANNAQYRILNDVEAIYEAR